MSPSFDFSASDLLCEESEDDYAFSSDGECESTWRHQGRRLTRADDDVDGGGDSIGGLPVQSDEFVLEMVKREDEYSAESGYFSRLRNGDSELVSRIEAVHWIIKVIAHYNFGPLCAYLAVSYLDRFLSAYKSPKSQSWMMQLLAVACLSLAAKMEENEVPLILDLQVAESKFVFEAKTIQRMELLVLSTLRWRMQAITPFSFIDHFLYKINGEKSPLKSAITLSTQFILSVIRGIDFLEFRSSEIAAAVAVSVGLETLKVEVDKSTHLLTEFVKKDRVLKCIEMIHGSSLRRRPDEGLNSNFIPCVPHSPIGVLDITCMSYKSDESQVGSCTNSSHISLGAKRRKLLV